MNNDTFEVNTDEAQGAQGKVALKDWPKKAHNFSLVVSFAYSFQIYSFQSCLSRYNRDGQVQVSVEWPSFPINLIYTEMICNINP